MGGLGHALTRMLLRPDGNVTPSAVPIFNFHISDFPSLYGRHLKSFFIFTKSLTPQRRKTDGHVRCMQHSAPLVQHKRHSSSPVGLVVKRITSNDKITGSIPVRGKCIYNSIFLMLLMIFGGCDRVVQDVRAVRVFIPHTEQNMGQRAIELTEIFCFLFLGEFAVEAKEMFLDRQVSNTLKPRMSMAISRRLRGR